MNYIILGLLFSLTSFQALAAKVELYSPVEAFADVLREPLTFVARANTDPSNPGGNWDCVYKNSFVYIIHPGCRPTTSYSLAVFFTYVISRKGGILEIYVEGVADAPDGKKRVVYDATTVGASYQGSWKLVTKEAPALSGELDFNEIQSFLNDSRNSYLAAQCSKTSLRNAFCTNNGTSANGELEEVWRSPSNYNFQGVHDAILFAHRPQ